jgi:MoaA/NifB/PqqE/SkfB family radical SAM enzyme
LCNQCKARVPAEFQIRDNQVWIRKQCPECGPNEALVSTDAKVWQAKRQMWDYVPTETTSCSLKCENCKIDHRPNMVFLDVTNRCNMNCPICIATIRGMGFDFNPPLEYFERIFDVISQWDPKPMVELFGGEPTVRKDILEIIAIGRRKGLKPRIVTNGLTMADEEFCKKLCDSRARMRFAFDGRSAEIYKKLRNNPGAYEKKMKALENLKKYSWRRQTLISCAAYGINDQYIGDMLQFCHDNRDLIADIGIIPLTENWDEGEFDAAKHTTMEDVEKMVADSVEEGQVEFVPAGFSYALRKPRSFLRPNSRSETLLLGGVHPNCESVALLFSNGKRYRSINHYLKKPFSQVAVEVCQLSDRVEPQLDKLDAGKFGDRLKAKWLLARTFLPWLFRSVKVGTLLCRAVADVPGNLWRSVRRLLSPNDPALRRRPRRMLRVAVLPFEEQHSVDAARMESCKAVFAYIDVDDDQVKSIPACMWYPYRNDILKKLSDKYGHKADEPTREEAEAGATAGTE